MERAPSSSITQLLRQWAAGSQTAHHELIPLVYHDLRAISRKILRGERKGSVTTTALVHDLYIKLSRYDSIEWNDRRHFFSFCAHLMRQILTDQARERQAQKRAVMLTPLGGDEIPWLAQSPAEYHDLDRALGRLAAAEPEKAQVVELRLYLGCTAEETAEILGIAKATVDRHMSFAKAWLFRQLRGSTKTPPST